MKKLRKIISVKGQSCQNIHDQLIYIGWKMRESGHFSKNLKITVNKGKKRKGK